MKLLFCANCSDVFKLGYKMRQCECGKVRGKYDENGATAETTDNEFTFNLAIGNGSLMQAIGCMMAHRDDTNDTATREEYYQPGNGKIEYAWVRPNTGPGNPHTRILEDADGKS